MRRRKDYIAYSTKKIANPKAAVDMCMELALGEGLTDESFVMANENRNDEFHDMFEWNDEEASREYRKIQAKEIITSLRLKEKEADFEMRLLFPYRPAYYRMFSKRDVYHPSIYSQEHESNLFYYPSPVLSYLFPSYEKEFNDSDLRLIFKHENLIEFAKRDLKLFCKRYKNLEELRELIGKIESELSSYEANHEKRRD